MNAAERDYGVAEDTAARYQRQTVTIGEVLAQLRPDFPDISISKIRFLEAEGLVEPQRSSSGYRRFTSDDVARLRYVLTVQRDHYLPLRVIKEQLEQLDRGLELVTENETATVTPYTSHTSNGDRRGDTLLSRSTLCEAAGVSDELLEELESFGLVTPSRTGTYDSRALVITRTVGELAEYGLRPRHLRALRTAAEREVDLIEQVVAPIRQQRGVDSRARVAEAATEVARLATRLHAALVDSGVSRVMW